jgi:excisionase family DNA binding protein
MTSAATARQVASELGVAERTVRRWIASGDLAAEKKGGAFLIDLDAARETFKRSRAGRRRAATGETPADRLVLARSSANSASARASRKAGDVTDSLPRPASSAATTEPLGAWAKPLAARKLHFFRDGYTSALCGAYMTMQVKPSDFAEGTLAVEGYIAVEPCPTCVRKHRLLGGVIGG